jgi:hypothetical protein
MAGTIDYDIAYALRETGEDGESLTALKATIQDRLDDGWTIIAINESLTSSMDIQHMVWYYK